MQSLRRKAEPKSQHLVLGGREIEARGLAGGFWSDLYYRSMTVSWPGFFASAAAIFLTLNGGFALVYLVGDQPIANAVPGRFLDLLYFSIETLATVGYGDMHPQTDYGHLVATVEIFTGMSFLAVMTGLVFARFSRPRARFIFAHNPIVGQHHGMPTLMVRVANARHNTISGTVARLWLIRAETTPEGQVFRRYYELDLHRNENPVFVLSWTVFHTIDESSPLFGISREELAETEAVLMLTLSGLDDNSAQQLNARQSYSHAHIRWQHRYVDIASDTGDGTLVLDYARFHDTTPEEARA
ncbi:MAG TPA: ion channel [Xanthobacteraceae bacterium]|nr:ion channel [Xanthobacteraceae bacterium]